MKSIDRWRMDVRRVQFWFVVCLNLRTLSLLCLNHKKFLEINFQWLSTLKCSFDLRLCRNLFWDQKNFIFRCHHVTFWGVTKLLNVSYDYNLWKIIVYVCWGSLSALSIVNGHQFCLSLKLILFFVGDMCHFHFKLTGNEFFGNL